MPQVRDIALKELTEGSNAVGVPATRVDSAHSLGDALTRLPPLAEMPVEQAVTDLVRIEGAVQLKLQADQLAAHLDRRRQDLDRRDAEFNARQAAFEQELREARQWLVQRNDELNQREAQLNAREEEFKAQGSGLSPDVTRAGHPSVPYNPPSPDAVVASPSVTTLSDGRERRDSLVHLSEELDRRRLALEEFREEVSQMHAEALELRSAAEELQAELRSSMGAPAAVSALAAMRERIANRFRNEAAYLTRRRSELEWLKKDLAEEHAKLEERYQEFKALSAQHSQGQPATDN